MTTALERENVELRRRLEALHVRVLNLHRDVGANEVAEMEQCRRRADSVAQRLGGGMTVSGPLQGEEPLGYRRRILKPFLQFSADHGRTDLSLIGHPNVLALVEDKVFADATLAAKTRNDAPPGRLVAHVERDAAGRRITKFDGDMMAWLSDFQADGARCSIVREK